MGNALFNRFENKYNNPIVFGGDCRYLNESLLLNANEQISNYWQLVLG